MLTLDLTNLFTVSPDHGISQEDITKEETRITPYIENIHARNQGFYTVIDDTDTVTKIESFAKERKGKHKHLVILAIGGSSLGTICLKQSLTHLFSHEISSQEHPTLHILDNIDPTLIREVQDVIDLSSTLFIVVTKSGGTPEILSQYFYFRSLCDKASLNATDHFVFVTDPKKGLLRKIGNEESIPMFDVPPTVGGRFSVQTPVGLLPAALIGIDIRDLLKGFQSMRDAFLSTEIEKNLPFQIATIQYLLRDKGKVMNVMMPYAQKLIRFSDWYRQLLAESIGKAENEKGELVHTGITPINALGVTDQHSQSQLYNEGPNDKLFFFLHVEKFGVDISIPNPSSIEEVSFLDNTTFSQLLHAEESATAMSCTKNDRPNMTIRISSVDEEHLGQLFMLFEGATAFLGEFYGINAFNQPGVELSKVLTREALLNR
ncbi:MAG: glucose-6-phosphate isomerase [Candidatus Magasanikbacteria bacterium]|nr:glucose-6-phosphate isomerase [Candidatus Magasanikbacteria bacterium]